MIIKNIVSSIKVPKETIHVPTIHLINKKTSKYHPIVFPACMYVFAFQGKLRMIFYESGFIVCTGSI